MTHLVERDDNDVGFGRWLRKFARCVTHPVENRHIADAENARDRTKTDVAHCIQKQGQRLHRRRLATWRRHGAIAAAREASIALDAAHNSIFYMIPSVRRRSEISEPTSNPSLRAQRRFHGGG